MTTFLIGAAVGWLITGVSDYFATRRAQRKAYEAGVTDGVRQVTSW